MLTFLDTRPYLKKYNTLIGNSNYKCINGASLMRRRLTASMSRASSNSSEMVSPAAMRMLTCSLSSNEGSLGRCLRRRRQHGSGTLLPRGTAERCQGPGPMITRRQRFSQDFVGLRTRIAFPMWSVYQTDDPLTGATTTACFESCDTHKFNRTLVLRADGGMV